ncbi:uncharacterized protein CTRU02_207541 [Colletotrichum truncatum]|uniref:Uncharacterized protein n=1 Tax=Colletotrichum truncatum TaxID=5467 RepID=A0ACC3Z145_COLTU|nr:uncharacterized protein CTRU02_00830 [Colletotrichum truncatum]KAF6800425.1 hypothetical protein CTRU02_00830 [Colletotrichum truncatum]
MNHCDGMTCAFLLAIAHSTLNLPEGDVSVAGATPSRLGDLYTANHPQHAPYPNQNLRAKICEYQSPKDTFLHGAPTMIVHYSKAVSNSRRENRGWLALTLARLQRHFASLTADVNLSVTWLAQLHLRGGD